jgi:hypothetical protein
MKNIVITITLLFCIAGAKGQITLEHKYVGGAPGYLNCLRILHFSSHGYMYEYFRPKSTTTGTIFLYNLSHALYKAIDVNTSPAADLSSGGEFSILYVSDSLFDTNPVSIEYMLYYEDSANFDAHIRIMNYSGRTLFSKDSVEPAWQDGNPWDFYPNAEPIFYTPAGYKMILRKGSQYLTFDSSAYVYSLPGALPCNECANGVIINAASQIEQGNNGGLLNAYPNPAKSSTTIKYQLPDGVNQGDLVFYDLQGKEIKSFTVDRTFDSLLVSTNDLAAGTYLYVLRAGGNYVGSKKMIIIK